MTRKYYVLAPSWGCCHTRLLGTSPEGEPMFCYSPAESGAIFLVGKMTHGPWTQRLTDLDAEIVFSVKIKKYMQGVS